ncbi:NifU family protein [Cyclobacteriaceae bacterium]|nr:NifU family protein [Cyclobacteriaceae bacterium]
MSDRIIHIYTEASPNPNSLKFVVNFDLIDGVSLDFPSIEETKNCPVAKDLFNEFDFIERVFISGNFITITKAERTDWFEVMPHVKEFIKNYIKEEKPLFDEDIKKQVVGEDLKEQRNQSDNIEIINQIKVVLEEYVKPAVESDGGAIAFQDYSEGKVTVLLQGSCSGCPSATVTLKNGVESLLKRMVPEVTEVVAEGVEVA